MAPYNRKNIAVLKFGGSTFTRLDDYRRIAKFLKGKLKKETDKLIVVVSAFAGLTEQFRTYAHQIIPFPSCEAMDSLLPLADTISAALLKIALEGEGVVAAILTGHQHGIQTDSNFSRARIRKMDFRPLARALVDNTVVVIPGGPATDTKGKPSWFGKNSSDLVAVAMAAMLGVKSCAIYSDVCGIYSGDPHVISKTRLIKKISYDQVGEMALRGAKVMHRQAVNLAKKHGIQIFCHKNRTPYSCGTVITGKNWANGIVWDKNSVLLDFSAESERVKAMSLFSDADVPFLEVREGDNRYLAVTGGYFNSVVFLRKNALSVEQKPGHLISLFKTNASIQHQVVAPHKAREICRKMHEEVIFS